MRRPRPSTVYQGIVWAKTQRPSLPIQPMESRARDGRGNEDQAIGLDGVGIRGRGHHHRTPHALAQDIEGLVGAASLQDLGRRLRIPRSGAHRLATAVTARLPEAALVIGIGLDLCLGPSLAGSSKALL